MFIVKAYGASDANAFITINPESSETTDTKIPAKSMKIKGTKEISFNGNTGAISATSISVDSANIDSVSASDVTASSTLVIPYKSSGSVNGEIFYY